jgi:hypothetical protein
MFNSVSPIGANLSSFQEYKKEQQALCEDIRKISSIIGTDPPFNLTGKLFKNSSQSKQIEILKTSQERSEDLFCKLWTQAIGAVKTHVNEKGETWIHQAISSLREKTITFLLDQGESIQTLDKNGSTPLDSGIRNFAGELYIRLVARDAGFSDEILKCRLFGHRFSLKGNLFEGIHPRWTRILVDSLLASISSTWDLTKSKRFDPSNFKNIKNCLSNSCSKDFEAHYQESKKLGTLLHCGWAKHATGVIFTSKLCITIDTGNEDGGIDFFHLGTFEKTTITRAMECLSNNYFNQVSEETGEKYLHTTLPQELQLSRIHKIEYSQMSGNCAWMVYKSALLAFFMLQEIGEKQVDEVIIKGSLGKVKEDFLIWDWHDSSESLRKAIPLLQKHHKYFGSYASIRSDLISNLLKETRIQSEALQFWLMSLIELDKNAKDWRDLASNKPLYVIAIERKFFRLLLELYKLGIKEDESYLGMISVLDEEYQNLSNAIKEGLADPKDQQDLLRLVNKYIQPVCIVYWV